MGYSANDNIERVVSAQFNQQQLILARQVAADIRNHFQFLRTSLTQANGFWERNSQSSGSIKAEMISHFDPRKEFAAVAMGHMGREGKVFLIPEDLHPLVSANLNSNKVALLDWAQRPENRGRILFIDFATPESGVFKKHPLIALITPTWKKSGDVKSEGFDGFTFVLVDSVAVAQRYARNIRSGKTGYAWVIDQKGIFLSHYETSFIGEDSLTVRQRRNPWISYARINEITRQHVLKGEEGASWYVSGWHRGELGEMKKLFAYSPIILAPDTKPPRRWSVGVTAPITEVYGAIQSLVLREWIILGIFQLIIFAGLAAVIFFSLRWSHILQAEVARRTADLKRSEEDVRQERDRVKESMKRLIEMQESLIRSERFAAIGEAAAHVSHEIKNPLMVIGGFATQIEKSLPSGDSNIKKLEIIRKEVERLEQLLTEVRDFTRPSKPKKELSDMHASIEETLALMQAEMESKDIICEKSFDMHLPPIQFDPQQIKQVLINLVKNAMEAMPQGGKMIITTRLNGNYLKVSVADTGMGIPPEAFKNMFSPFFTTKKKGTGLGLTVCYRIVEDHKGEIICESRKGEGTKFIFSLPLRSKEDQENSR